MPPKSKPAASAASASSASTEDSQRTKDALYLFDSLFHVAQPVMINAVEIAEKTGSKANSVAKRFSVIRSRHVGLKIQTTTSAPAASDDAVATSVPPTPVLKKISAPRTTSTNNKGARKTAAKVQNDMSEDDPAMGAESSDSKPLDDANKGSEDETKPKPIKNGAPATPAGAMTDNNLADDEKTVKKPQPRAAAKGAKKADGKAGGATKGPKRKRAEDDQASGEEVKKPKVVKRNKKSSKTKEAEASDEKIAVDDEESSNNDIKKPVAKPPTSTSAGKKQQSTIMSQQESELNDVVNGYANKSRKNPITKSPANATSSQEANLVSAQQDTDADAKMTDSGEECEAYEKSAGPEAISEPSETASTQPESDSKVTEVDKNVDTVNGISDESSIKQEAKELEVSHHAEQPAQPPIVPVIELEAN